MISNPNNVGCKKQKGERGILILVYGGRGKLKEERNRGFYKTEHI